jgi:tetratricopeptide (TPR) repeat protein
MRTNIRGIEAGVLAMALGAMITSLSWAMRARADVALDEAQDYENRVEFGYLSEDAKALRALIRTLGALAEEDDGDPRAHYLAAHADYRLALVLDATHKPDAEDAAKACLEELTALTRRDSRDVEAFVQKAACHGFLAGNSVIKGVTHGPAAGDAVAVALRLAPKNPRAHLVDALVDYWRSGKHGDDRAQVFEKFKQAAEFFEALPPGSSEFPSWGSADVYYWLGTSYIDRGDIAAARSALEQALIVAPDFAAVRRQLVRLSTPR